MKASIDFFKFQTELNKFYLEDQHLFSDHNHKLLIFLESENSFIHYNGKSDECRMNRFLNDSKKFQLPISVSRSHMTNLNNRANETSIPLYLSMCCY